MDRLPRRIVWGLLLIAGVGCSKSSQPAPVAVDAGTPPAHVEVPPRGMPDRDATPDQVVTVFLNAAQSGNATLLSALLSTIARAETAKHNMNLQLDSAQSAKFQVGKYEYVTPEKDGAHVECIWTDQSPDGTAQKNTVIWVLRKEDAGWRVVGMISRPFPDLRPVVLNYEDIPSFVAERNFIMQEESRREAEQQRQESQKKMMKPLTASATPSSNAVTQPTAGNVEREAMKSPAGGSTAPK
jgi:hypothetical protein